jgi:hypothetical protein
MGRLEREAEARARSRDTLGTQAENNRREQREGTPMTDGEAIRQVSVERLFDDNQRSPRSDLARRSPGGNRVLTGEAALKPTIGQVGHMNFIHPFRSS